MLNGNALDVSLNELSESNKELLIVVRNFVGKELSHYFFDSLKIFGGHCHRNSRHCCICTKKTNNVYRIVFNSSDYVDKHLAFYPRK